MASHGFHETSNDILNISNIPTKGSDNKKEKCKETEKMIENKFDANDKCKQGKELTEQNCPEKLSVQGDRLEESSPH